MIVPEPRFYLKNPSIDESTLICLQAKYNGNRVFMSTGNKVHPIDWDFDKQRTKVTRRNLGNSDINLWLDKMAAEFKSVFRNLQIDGIEPTAILVTKKMQENLNLINKPSIPTVEKLTLIPFIKQYIIEAANIKSPVTVKSYGATLNHLEKYSDLLGKQIDFADITIEWRSGFLKYLQDFGLTRTTEGKHIKIIKVFLNEATERGLNDNLAFRSRSFSKPNEDVPKVFLTIDEIQLLISLDLSNDKLKDIVRDYFIISCYTSLRYSDFINIGSENIKGGTIQMITRKTGEEVIIPIAPPVKTVFEKYDYSLPTAPCNQVFNSTLKDVARLAGITELITITKTIAGVKQTKIYEKCQLLSCHTGRRSMISNSILNGIPTPSIMLISGHKSLKVFQSYVRINQQQNADALQQHSFFN